MFPYTFIEPYLNKYKYSKSNFRLNFERKKFLNYSFSGGENVKKNTFVTFMGGMCD